MCCIPIVLSRKSEGEPKLMTAKALVEVSHLGHGGKGRART